MNKEMLFWFCAISGSAMLVIQLILNIFGIATHHDVGDFHDGLDTDSHDFKWLSKQAIFGFLTMFGWVGLACLKEFKLNVFLSVFIAFIAGFIAMVVTGFIFRITKTLHSVGDVFKIEDAIGLEATVYQQILKQDKGKVLLSLNGLTREVDAVSLTGEEIKSFSKVKIIEKVDDATVSVVPVKVGDL